MPTEMELTLEQTQQGVSYDVSNIQVISFTMKMEIMLGPTSNKLIVERFDTLAGNPVKEILLKLNLPDHRIFIDGGEARHLCGRRKYEEDGDDEKDERKWQSMVLEMKIKEIMCSKREIPVRV
ncbi:hypothetical protein Tco_0465376 [Tanacetum coccineum]